MKFVEKVWIIFPFDLMLNNEIAMSFLISWILNWYYLKRIFNKNENYI